MPRHNATTPRAFKYSIYPPPAILRPSFPLRTPFPFASCFYSSVRNKKMRTRRGVCYINTACHGDTAIPIPARKRRRISSLNAEECGDFFDSLPDDLVFQILCKLCSSARCPSDFVNVLMTCKRLNGLGMNSLVLSQASPGVFTVRAKNWSDCAHRFFRRCADAGNVEACYTLGMIWFYCLQNRGGGASLMAKAAIRSHSPALYSLAIIQFNGSGGNKSNKDLRAGVALCARAAHLGYVDALRELGHCLQDGYGVPQNVAEGRRFLVQANARELAAVLAAGANMTTCPPSSSPSRVPGLAWPLMSDFGWNVPSPEPHPANKFMSEWYAVHSTGPDLRLCSHGMCGRPETRKHEFRRCSVCGIVNYCSRACQALDWKLRHKAQCMPVEQWMEVYGGEQHGRFRVYDFIGQS